MFARFTDSQKSSLLAVVATVLTIFWVVDTVENYRSGTLLESEGGTALYFDEVSVLEHLGASLLIADAGASRHAFERYLYGAYEVGSTLNYTENVLTGLHASDRLSEEGLVFLASVQWASGEKNKALATTQKIAECEYSGSQTLLDLLAGEELQAYQLEDLESDLKSLPRDWVSCFLADQITRNGIVDFQTGEELNRLSSLRREDLFVSNARLAVLWWCLILAGVTSIIVLWRSKSELLPQSLDENVSYLWPLPLVLSVFVIGEFAAELVPEALFFWVAWDLSPAVIWCGQVAYISTFQVIGSLVLLCVFFRPMRWQNIRETFFQPVKHLWLWVLGAYTVTVAFDAILYQLPFPWFPKDPTIGFQWQEFGLSGLIMGLISAVIFAPIFEEIVFRGFLFSAFKNKLGVHLAAVVSAVIFAGVHFYGMQDLIAVGFFGLVMAYLYHYTRSLIPCILCHALFNLIVTCWGWLIDRSPEAWWAL